MEQVPARFDVIAQTVEPAPTHSDLAAQLRALASEYVEMRSWALGLEARRYNALLAGALFAVRARGLQERTVPLFRFVAHLLLSVEQTRNIRLQLWRTSERLRWLFSDEAANKRLDAGEPRRDARRGNASGLRDAFYTRDGDPGSEILTELHDAIISVADAAAGALFAWRPPLIIWRARRGVSVGPTFPPGR